MLTALLLLILIFAVVLLSGKQIRKTKFVQETRYVTDPKLHPFKVDPSVIGAINMVEDSYQNLYMVSASSNCLMLIRYSDLSHELLVKFGEPMTGFCAITDEGDILATSKSTSIYRVKNPGTNSQELSIDLTAPASLSGPICVAGSNYYFMCGTSLWSYDRARDETGPPAIMEDLPTNANITSVPSSDSYQIYVIYKDGSAESYQLHYFNTSHEEDITDFLTENDIGVTKSNKVPLLNQFMIIGYNGQHLYVGYVNLSSVNYSAIDVTNGNVYSTNTIVGNADYYDGNPEDTNFYVKGYGFGTNYIYFVVSGQTNGMIDSRIEALSFSEPSQNVTDEITLSQEYIASYCRPNTVVAVARTNYTIGEDGEHDALFYSYGDQYILRYDNTEGFNSISLEGVSSITALTASQDKLLVGVVSEGSPSVYVYMADTDGYSTDNTRSNEEMLSGETIICITSSYPIIYANGSDGQLYYSGDIEDSFSSQHNPSYYKADNTLSFISSYLDNVERDSLKSYPFVASNIASTNGNLYINANGTSVYSDNASKYLNFRFKKISAMNGFTGELIVGEKAETNVDGTVDGGRVLLFKNM